MYEAMKPGPILTLDGLITSLQEAKHHIGTGKVPVLLFGAIPETLEGINDIGDMEYRDVKTLLISPANTIFHTIMGLNGSEGQTIVGIGQDPNTYSMLNDNSIDKIFMLDPQNIAEENK